MQQRADEAIEWRCCLLQRMSRRTSPRYSTPPTVQRRCTLSTLQSDCRTLHVCLRVL